MSVHPRILPDVQASAPTLHVSLSRVGVTGVEKVIRLSQGGVERLFSAELECFVDLGPNQKGAHMSRFEETVNDAIGEVVLGEASFRAEQLAVHIAELVRGRQNALRAEVTLRAQGVLPPASRASRPRRSTRCTARPWRRKRERADSSA